MRPNKKSTLKDWNHNAAYLPMMAVATKVVKKIEGLALLQDCGSANPKMLKEKKGCVRHVS